MSKEIVIMIIGMAIVTYIPRMLPFVMFRGKELPPFLRQCRVRYMFAERKRSENWC